MTAAATPRRPITEEAFLDAATDLFAQQGYGATSVDQIALRAGSTKPTLYARFSSKEELYARAVEREASLLTRHLFAAYDRAEREGLREGVSLGMRAAFEFAQLRPGGTALLFEPDVSAPSGEVSERAVRQVIERVARIMRPILADEERRRARRRRAARRADGLALERRHPPRAPPRHSRSRRRSARRSLRLRSKA